MQKPSGSSLPLLSRRSAKSACAHGVITISPGFRSAARLKLYFMSVCQMPDRSTVPYAVRGVGALTSIVAVLARWDRGSSTVR